MGPLFCRRRQFAALSANGRPARGELWCALDADDNIAGVMRIVPRGFCGLYHYLALIGVAPGARGQGVGRYMMGEFERMAAAGRLPARQPARQRL